MAAKWGRVIAAGRRTTLLAKTMLLPKNGMEPVPLPFDAITAPVAELLRAAPRARAVVESMLCERLEAMRERRITPLDRWRVSTSYGWIEMQCSSSSYDCSARLEMGPAYILNRELVLRDVRMSDTMAAGLVGEKVSIVADVPFIPADARIRSVRPMTGSTRIRLDLPGIDVFLSELIGAERQRAAEDADEMEVLALCA